VAKPPRNPPGNPPGNPSRKQEQIRRDPRQPRPQGDPQQVVPTFPGLGAPLGAGLGAPLGAGLTTSPGASSTQEAPPPAPPTPAQAVTATWVHGDQVSYSFMHSLLETLGLDMATSGRLLVGGYISIRYGTDGLPYARNLAVRNFLADHASDWLFMADTDMGWPADTVERLFAAAHPADRPIVGALCFAQIEQQPDGLGGWMTVPTPTIYDWAKVPAAPDAPPGGPAEQMGFAVRYDYPPNALTRCAGTGAACVLIHRNVFTRLAEKYGPVWFDRVPNTTTGQLIGEDLSFFLRCGTLGIPVHVDTGVRTSHLKRVWLGEEQYAAARLAYPDAPPATVPVTPMQPGPEPGPGPGPDPGPGAGAEPETETAPEGS
jgi:hypothetical protein